MKRILYTISACIVFLTGCSSNNTKQKDVDGAQMKETIANKPASSPVMVGNVEGYFTTLNPRQPVVMIIDNQKDFDDNFNPARTMDNNPTKIDFNSNNVGALVLSPTDFETRINIDTVYNVRNILHVFYTTQMIGGRRSFSITPQNVFTFDKSLGIDSIYFTTTDMLLKAGRKK